MSEDRYEAVSAMADGEYLGQDAAKLGEAIAGDPEARRRWARYHLIGDALRGGLPPRLDTGFADRLRAAVTEEPAMLAPARPTRAGVLRPVAGLAIAASVAALAVVGLQQLNSGAGEAPVAARSQAVLPPVEVADFDPAAGAGSRLSGYLIDHVEQQGSTTVPGLVPYVRIVGEAPAPRRVSAQAPLGGDGAN